MSDWSSQDKRNAAAGGIGILGILVTEMQADSIRKEANFQADVMSLNSTLLDVQAATEQRQGIYQSNRYMAEAEQVKAQQQALFASQGQDTVGAAGDVIAQSDLNAALNRLDIETKAAIASSKYKYQAQQNLLNADITRYQGSTNANMTRISGYISTLSNSASMAASGG